MAFTKQESSEGFSKQAIMKPVAIEASDMSEGPSSDTSSTKKAPKMRKEAEREKEDDEHVPSSQLVILLTFSSGFLILNAPDKVLVVDVYLGEEKKLVQLPAKLARGLATLLLKAPERSTTYTPAEDALWQSLDLDGWWGEIIKTETVSGGGNQTYHVTESLSLPQIGVDRFNAFKEWAKGKTVETFTRACDNDSSEEQARVSRKRLHLDLWTVLDEFSYEKNVRASSEGVETESDPDDDVGEAHGGGDVQDMGPLHFPGDEPKPRENWDLIHYPKDK